jgi:hypothetical protein
MVRTSAARLSTSIIENIDFILCAAQFLFFFRAQNLPCLTQMLGLLFIFLSSLAFRRSSEYVSFDTDNSCFRCIRLFRLYHFLLLLRIKFEFLVNKGIRNKAAGSY